MIKLKKILVPTDFSDNAATAYNVAHRVAGRMGATVDFLHVIQTLSHYNKAIARLSVPIKTAEDLYPQLKKQAMHKLKKRMGEYLQPVNTGQPITCIADQPYKAIADEAKAGGYDLIVMATLGEHDSNFMIGSVAEKVIRYASVPVLSTGSPHLDEIKNILVPTDGSPISFDALPMALSLALAFDSTITLLHIEESVLAEAETAGESAYKSADYHFREAILAELEEYIAALPEDIKLERGQGTPAELIYREAGNTERVEILIAVEQGASAHRTITQYAGQSADLVVMTTHGRSGLAHVLIGSTAENVVRRVRLPVITVKPRSVMQPAHQ